MNISAWIGLPYFVLGAFALTYCLFLKNLGLKIDNEGIVIDLPFQEIGLLKWSEIIDSKIEEVITTEYLVILVKNPENYLRKSYPLIGKLFGFGNIFAKADKGIYFHCGGLAMPITEILRLINSKLQTARLNLSATEETERVIKPNLPISENNKMKKCLYCAEEIKFEAIKCRYCGELVSTLGNFAKELHSQVEVTHTDFEEKTSESLPPVYMFSLIVCIGLFAFFSMESIKFHENVTAIKYIVASLVFYFIAPYIWRAADAVRKYAEPTLYFGNGFVDLVGKRFFWSYGPQVIALFVTVGFIVPLIGIPKEDELEVNNEEVSKSVPSSVAASENPSNMVNNRQVEDVKKEIGASNNFQQEIPDLRVHVNDLTNTLSSDEKYKLEEKFNLVQKLNGINISILIIPSTHPENFAQFCYRAKTKWQLVEPNYLNGVLVIFTSDNKQLNIFIGNSVNANLDSQISRILNESFSQTDYYISLNNAAEEFTSLNAEQILIKPSFDCNKATSTSELLICNDSELSKLDNDLAETYQKAKSITLNPDALKEETKAAWKLRESTCSDKECLLNWYAERKAALVKVIQESTS